MVDDLDAIMDNAEVDNPVVAQQPKSPDTKPTIKSARICGYKLIVSCSCSLDLNVQPGADDFRVFDGDTELCVQSAYIEHPIIVDNSQIVIALDHLFVGEVALRIRYEPEDQSLLMAESKLRMEPFEQTLLAQADIGKPRDNSDVAETLDSAQTESADTIVNVPLLTDSVNIEKFEKVRVTSTELNKQRFTLTFDKALDLQFQPLVNDFNFLVDSKPQPLQSVFLAKKEELSPPALVFMLAEQPAPGSILELQYKSQTHSLRGQSSGLSLAAFNARMTTRDFDAKRPPQYNAMLKATQGDNRFGQDISIPTLGMDQIVYRPKYLHSTDNGQWLKRVAIAGVIIAFLAVVFS